MDRKIFNEEHRIFREAFKKFLSNEVAPHLNEWEEAGIVPRSVWKKLGEYGYLCPWLEERYGGSGVGFEYSVVIIEELSYVCATGLAVGLHGDIVVPYIDSFGSEEQKSRWLPGCVSGDIITAIAMTEPGAGSDLASIRTTAIKIGDHYVINGQKTFISNGINADLIIVAVKTNTQASSPVKGISLIFVEEGTHGFTKGRKLEKMGLRSQDTAELIFEDCRVPFSHLLGEEGEGFNYLMQKLQRERLIVVIQAQAMAEAMLDLTVKYCKERTVFGRSVGSFQHNTFKVVEMATEIELGRVFVDNLIREHIEGKDITKKVSMAKAWVCEMTNRVAYHCLQLHGGYGYMEEYPICRFARDTRAFPIVGGTTEVMKVIVGRIMGL